MIAVNDEAAPAFFCLSLSLFWQWHIFMKRRSLTLPAQSMERERDVILKANSYQNDRDKVNHCLYITAGFLRVD